MSAPKPRNTPISLSLFLLSCSLSPSLFLNIYLFFLLYSLSSFVSYFLLFLSFHSFHSSPLSFFTHVPSEQWSRTTCSSQWKGIGERRKNVEYFEEDPPIFESSLLLFFPPLNTAMLVSELVGFCQQPVKNKRHTNLTLSFSLAQLN